MIQKAITLKVPTVLAVAFGTTISIGLVYMTSKYLVPVDQAKAHRTIASSSGSAGLPIPDGRLSRVHLLLRSL
jgi:hypothetical protein